MKKRLTALLLACSLSLLAFAGCKKELTKEDIISKCKTNVESIKDATVHLDLALGMKAKVGEIETPINFDVNFQAAVDKELDLYLNGQVKYTVLEESGDEQLQVYVDINDDKTEYTVSVFNPDDNSWDTTNEELDLDEYKEDIKKLESVDMFDFLLSKESAELTLAEETVKSGDKDCYKFTGKLNLKEFYEYAIEKSKIELEETEDLDLSAIEGISVPFTFYVDNKDFMPVFVSVELLDIFKDSSDDIEGLLAMLIGEAPELSFDTFKFELKFSDINKTNVTIPEEILKENE